MGSGHARAAAKVVELVAGGDDTCARTDDGEWWCWGDNTYGQLGSDPGVTPCGTADSPTVCFPQPTRLVGIGRAKEVALGGSTTCVLDLEGGVRCWGRHETLGRGSTPDERCVMHSLSGPLSKLTPTDVAIPCSRTPAPVVGLKEVRVLALGSGFGCAASTDQVSCWGDDSDGRLGVRRDALVECPNHLRCAVTAIALNKITTVRTVAVGGSSAAALLPNGRVATWGWDYGGQLGRPGNDEPEIVPDLEHVDQLALGSLFACALHRGRVSCWGDGEGGRLGLEALPVGRSGFRSADQPTLLSGLDHVKAIASSPQAQHACALLGDGAVRCWGQNDSGQLGTGDTQARVLPTLLRGLRNVAQVAVGANHTCALTTDRGVFCWGAGHHGQLGIATPPGGDGTLGTITDAHVPCSLVPVHVPGL